jgi:Asp-tRNA(Asn)/Glu-tRNA(Gln) amidotransferase C subunit
VNGREWGDVMREDEQAMDEALAAIAQRSPSTAKGYVK